MTTSFTTSGVPIPVTVINWASTVTSNQGTAGSAPWLVHISSSVSLAVTGTFWQAVQPVIIASPGNFSTSQVSVEDTSTLIIAARAGRLGVIITQLGAIDIYIGNTGVTITTGVLLLGVKGTTMSMLFNGAIYGVTVGGTQTVSVAEVF